MGKKTVADLKNWLLTQPDDAEIEVSSFTTGAPGFGDIATPYSIWSNEQ